MKVTQDDARFVLYNNRSLNGVTLNFLWSLQLDPRRLYALDRDLARCNNAYKEESTLQVNMSDLVIGAPDIEYAPADVLACSDVVADSHDALLNPVSDDEVSERAWLEDRGFGSYHISEYRLGSLSRLISLATSRQLEVLGISRHPMLSNLIDDDLSGGGILFPLYDQGALINLTTRRISDVGKLKYTQSCPDMHVWGLSEQCKQHPTWVCEGILDKIAVDGSVSPFSPKGVSQAVSVSGAMWSTPQLLQLIDGTGEHVNIFADNDRVGLRSAAVLKMLLEMHGKRCDTYVSRYCKDAADHFTAGHGWGDVVRIDITQDTIGGSPNMEFNFTKYLKERKF
jgi:hypothetical protein